MPASPGQSTAIPFRATGIAIYLENNGTPETVQKIVERSSQSAFRYFEVAYKCA